MEATVTDARRAVKEHVRAGDLAGLIKRRFELRGEAWGALVRVLMAVQPAHADGYEVRWGAVSVDPASLDVPVDLAALRAWLPGAPAAALRYLADVCDPHDPGAV